MTIGKPFAVGKFEVTFAEWDACVPRSGCTQQARTIEGWGRGRRPVINVSWDDAKQYVAWLSKKTGKTYRLLTEAEWEYAARAGTTTRVLVRRHNQHGSGELQRQLHLWRQQEGRLPAEDGRGRVSLRPNAFGLHDMHGNVWEWVEDCYADNYSGAPTDGTKAAEVASCRRVLRGGGWY